MCNFFKDKTLNSKVKSVVFFLLLAIFLSIKSVAIADLITKTAEINDIPIYFQPCCGGEMKQINLGDLSISLSDSGASSLMESEFRVNPYMEYTDRIIFDCMELHFLQTIWHDDDPVTYQGVLPDLPIIDPPNGGWDYMYIDGANRTNPNLGIPNFGWFIDGEPWYYNSTGEAAQFTVGNFYQMNDLPTDPSSGFTGFSTYLMAESTTSCNTPDCIQPNEMLLLAGFDWLISLTDIVILDTFKAPAPIEIADISQALIDANFMGWTVLDSNAVCCVPEPSTFLLIGISLVCVVFMRRRSRN